MAIARIEEAVADPLRTRRKGDRRGFTAVELLVLLGIVLVLLGIFVPYFAKVRERSRRTYCAENLRAVGLALSTYAKDNWGWFPIVVHDHSKPNTYVAFSGSDSEDPFGPRTRVRANDVTACLWLLVRGGYVRDEARATSVFVCPSSEESAENLSAGAAVRRSNFRDGRALSYSYCSPFTDTPGFKMDDLQDASFVVMADKNPGRARRGDVAGPGRDGKPLELARANSLNHDRAGQNVLHRSGSVSFEVTPYCGIGGDNIYTALDRKTFEAGKVPRLDQKGVCTNTVGPGWPSDSFLVPTAEELDPPVAVPAGVAGGDTVPSTGATSRP